MGRYTGTLDRDLFQARVSGAVIAAGLSVPVPAEQNWKILGVSILYTATATVGARVPTIEVLDDGDALLAAFASGTNVTANQTVSINFALGGYPVAAAGSAILTAWDAWAVLVALAGQRLRITDQASIDITDTAKVLVSGEWEGTD